MDNHDPEVTPDTPTAPLPDGLFMAVQRAILDTADALNAVLGRHLPDVIATEATPEQVRVVGNYISVHHLKQDPDFPAALTLSVTDAMVQLVEERAQQRSQELPLHMGGEPAQA